MPKFRKGETPATSTSPEPLPELNRRLLDATTHNLTSILRAPESLFAPKRALASLRDALKQLDRLYPVVLEGERDEAARGEVEHEGQRPADIDRGGGPDGDVHLDLGRAGGGDGPAAPIVGRGADEGP